jgi:sensor histidine kinase YesM
MSSKTALTVFYHFLFWILMWMIPMVLLPIVEPWEFDYEDAGIPRVFYIFFMTGGFYFNLFVLYPAFMVPKKTTHYIVSALLTGIVIGIVYCTIFYAHIDGPVIIHIILKSLLALVFIACSTVYKVILDSIREQRLRQMKETENLRTELSFLRSQISPHFMFNVLNTIVALIRQRSEKLEPVVIELSNLMRYMLYESDEENVSLKTELRYLQSYIDLQMQRFGTDILLNIDIPGEVPDRYIEPMLLIPLVENAFKHGCRVIDHPEISISLSLTHRELSMSVQNKYVATSSFIGKNSGIGLNNLRRRLNLLYPKRHALSIDTAENWFNVLFTLEFREDIVPANPIA